MNNVIMIYSIKDGDREVEQDWLISRDFDKVETIDNHIFFHKNDVPVACYNLEYFSFIIGVKQVKQLNE